MLGLVAERSCHAAAGRIEAFDREAGDQLQCLHRRTDSAERFLVAMPVQQSRAALHRRQCQSETARGALAFDELLEEPGAFGKRLGSGTRQEHRKFVAQGQQAGWLQPDDRCASLDIGHECIHGAPGLMACLVDKASRKERTPAAQRSAARRVR